jgi:hypothetical protein
MHDRQTSPASLTREQSCRQDKDKRNMFLHLSILMGLLFLLGGWAFFLYTLASLPEALTSCLTATCGLFRVQRQYERTQYCQQRAVSEFALNPYPLERFIGQPESLMRGGIDSNPWFVKDCLNTTGKVGRSLQVGRLSHSRFTPGFLPHW